MSVTVGGPEARRPGRGTATAVLASALVLALGAVVWLLVDRAGTTRDLDAARAEQSSAEEGLTAATNFLTTATTYSWREGEHDFDWLDQIGDEEVRAGIEESVGALQASVVDEQLTAQGQVVDAAVRVVDASHVEVLAFVDQELARAGDEQVSVDQMRIVVTMSRTGGTWLVDDLVFQSGGLGDPGTAGALD